VKKDKEMQIGNINDKNIILDDFFVLSNSYKNSSHYELLSPAA